MWWQLIAILSFLISALAISLRKFYLESPLIEPPNGQSNPALRRRSVKSTKREHVLSGFLIILAVICFCLFAVLAEGYLFAPVYFVVLAVAVYFVFIYLSGKESGRLIMDIAGFLTPFFIGLLNKTRQQTKNLERIFDDRQKAKTINRHMTKTEILEMLRQQKTNYEGRSLAKGLATAINSIDIGSKRVEDFMLPMADAHIVKEKETVGPILIDELHKSGYLIFPVCDRDSEIVATVRLSDLVDLSEESRAIADVASSDLQYLDEEDNVMRAFESFLQTGATMFIVKADSKNTGVLYLENLVSQLLTED